MNKKYSKRIRLKDFNYKGFYRYFLTICTFEKSKYFTDNGLVYKVLDVLREVSNHCQFDIWAYCFMPDHLHLLIEGKDESSDMCKFVALFKQYSGYQFKKECGRKLWEENYYEHILRKKEATQKVATYIFENPIRKGIVEDYTSYPYLGSFVFGLDSDPKGSRYENKECSARL